MLQILSRTIRKKKDAEVLSHWVSAGFEMPEKYIGISSMKLLKRLWKGVLYLPSSDSSIRYWREVESDRCDCGGSVSTSNPWKELIDP